jgi:hypothetical protein
VIADVEMAVAARLGRQPTTRDDGATQYDGTVRKYAKIAIERWVAIADGPGKIAL